MLAPFFPNRKHVLLVAIHVEPDLQLAAQDVRVAHQAGADGVIFVNNNASVGANRLCTAFHAARPAYKDWFLGLNMLGTDPLTAMRNTPASANGLWFDDSRIDESQDDHDAISYLRDLRQEQLKRAPGLCLMPSVSMKYIGAEDDERVARLAAPFGDVIITSGNATGSAPDVKKIQRMVKAMPPEVPLAIASGTDIDNVDDLKQAGARVFIVNTKICKPNIKDRIDLELATALAQKIHA